jgi:anaerobic ribonucleoside-triphosphate reductase activating protein
MSDHVLNIAEILFQSEANGPGQRTVIWLQGCRKNCVNCCNPEFRSTESGITYAPDAIVNHVACNTNQFRDIEGITFSGGEPFDQAEALLPVAESFRENGLTLMAFSGYSIDELLTKNASTAAMLGMLDILVDGEYIESLTCSRLWRSSYNQTVHFLTDRYRHYSDWTNRSLQEYEMIIENDHLVITGFPDATKGTSDLFHSSFIGR